MSGRGIIELLAARLAGQGARSTRAPALREVLASAMPERAPVTAYEPIASRLDDPMAEGAMLSGADDMAPPMPSAIRTGPDAGPSQAGRATPEPMHPAFEGMSREEFLGDPRITTNRNAADLKPKALTTVRDQPAQPFMGRYEVRMSEDGAAVYDGENVIASYNFGDTLVVDRAHRRQGIAQELVYQWRTRYPGPAVARERTRASQAIQEQVWERIKNHPGDGGNSGDGRGGPDGGPVQAGRAPRRIFDVDGEFSTDPVVVIRNPTERDIMRLLRETKNSGVERPEQSLRFVTGSDGSIYVADANVAIHGSMRTQLARRGELIDPWQSDAPRPKGDGNIRFNRDGEIEVDQLDVPGRMNLREWLNPSRTGPNAGSDRNALQRALRERMERE